MKLTEKIALRGPFGWLKIQVETTPIVMLANDVDITPIRSLLKKLEFNTNRPIEIDYSLFGDEIKNIAMSNPMIQLYKMASRKKQLQNWMD